MYVLCITAWVIQRLPALMAESIGCFLNAPPVPYQCNQPGTPLGLLLILVSFSLPLDLLPGGAALTGTRPTLWGASARWVTGLAGERAGLHEAFRQLHGHYLP